MPLSPAAAMPNRSMMRRALRLSRAGYRRRADADGPVTFVAVFPDDAFGADVLSDFDPASICSVAAAIMPTGLRPVTQRVWWKPDDPADPGGTGVAVVRLDDYGYPEDRVYVHRVEPGDSVDVYTLWDKPHRVKWAEDRPGMVISTDPAVIRATRFMFDCIGNNVGFIPDMTLWLSTPEQPPRGLHNGRWFLALEWDPRDGYEVLRDTVALMDGLRRDLSADIRLYGTHVWHRQWGDGRAPTTLWRDNQSWWVRGSDAAFFTTAMKAFRESPRDMETWKLYGSAR